MTFTSADTNSRPTLFAVISRNRAGAFPISVPVNPSVHASAQEQRTLLRRQPEAELEAIHQLPLEKMVRVAGGVGAQVELCRFR